MLLLLLLLLAAPCAREASGAVGPGSDLIVILKVETLTNVPIDVGVIRSATEAVMGRSLRRRPLLPCLVYCTKILSTPYTFSWRWSKVHVDHTWLAWHTHQRPLVQVTLVPLL